MTPQKVMVVSEHASIDFPEIVAGLCRDVRQALPADRRAWVVGGAVRDALLQRPIHDLDFVVEHDGIACARAVAQALQAAFYPLDAARDVGRVILTRAGTRFVLDFARLRGPDLAADLAARDFTINALATPLEEPEAVMDTLGGQADLRARVIRACSPTALADDPVRGIRAVRLATQLNFRIEPATRELIRSQAAAITQVAAERSRDELIRCMASPRPSGAVRALDRLGLLDPLVPELTALKGVTQSPPHMFDVWEHSLETAARLSEALGVLRPVHDVDAASDVTLGQVSVKLGRYRQPLTDHLQEIVSSDRPARWLLLIAALMHDIGKPATRTVEADSRIRFIGHEGVGADLAAHRLGELRFSGDEVKRVRTIIAHHMRPRQLSRTGSASARAIYRFFRDTGPAGVDIILLSLGDYLAKADASPPQADWAGHLDVCAKMLAAYFERHAQAVAPEALINGADLIAELGMVAGPEIGQVLEAIREAQAAGEINDRAAALDFARRRIQPS